MRAFIALELGEEICGRLEVELLRLRKLAPFARWVKPESLHLTLAFLGEIADAGVPAICEALAKAARRHAPLNLKVSGNGTFGPLLAPKVLWAGVEGELGALAALQADVAAGLAELGHRPDFEQFEPHVTLARSKNPRGDPELTRCADALRGAAFGQVRVGEVALFSSHTDAEGMRYAAIARCELRR